MVCINCKPANPDTNHYCGECGAELGHSSLETISKRDIRDRKAIEYEIVDTVVKRLLEWAKWLGNVLTLLLAASPVWRLGKTYLDLRTGVRSATAQIETAVREGKGDIEVVRKKIGDLRDETLQLQTDVDKYKKVNSAIADLQIGLQDRLATALATMSVFSARAHPKRPS
jgi:hypothetical protein